MTASTSLVLRLHKSILSSRFRHLRPSFARLPATSSSRTAFFSPADRASERRAFYRSLAR
eukprot:scaffold1721_cov242-Pinguiococcus_pyrenoidosus.AAC.2